MSEIKVNKLSPRSGTTVTLGDSGDTITIPSGATINNQGTATNFGATGSASWNTTVKTGDFTAGAGEGYFVDTTSQAIDVTLPAGTAGAVVAIKDYAGTFDTNAVTLAPNGSDKIGGDNTTDATLTTEGIAVTLVFVDSTQGWLVTDSGLQSEAPTAQFITATGGTITTVCTNFKVHTFTAPGTFTVCSTGNPAGSNTIDYMVVAGGGGAGGSGAVSGGGGYGSGGAGAGGYRESAGTSSGSYTVSPLGSGVAGVTATVASFPIVIGAGGAAGISPAPSYPEQVGSNGSSSSGLSITSAGGGGGAGATGTGGSGGSGGGKSTGGAAGSGNTPPVSPPQGNDGGGTASATGNMGGGGGGGATAAGGTGAGAPPSPSIGGTGGTGATSSINATPTQRAGGGGGGGGRDAPCNAAGGSATGGGGAGGSTGTAGSAGTVNTGGGGGGSGGNPGKTGGAGGSGIVIVRYKFQ